MNTKLLYSLGLCAAAGLACLAWNALPHSLADRIAAHAAKTGYVDVPALTDFRWRRVLVFMPYTPGSRICESLGAQWPPCASPLPTGVGEGEFLLVFTNGTSVVHHEILSTARVLFCDNFDLPAAQAKFRLIQGGLKARPAAACLGPQQKASDRPDTPR